MKTESAGVERSVTKFRFCCRFHLFIAVLSVYVFASSSMGHNPQKHVSMQVYAKTDTAELVPMTAKLSFYNIPYYITHTEKNGKTYHRLRIGPMVDSTIAKPIAEFLELKSFWIVEPDGKDNVISSAIIDTINLVPIGPELYIGKSEPFFCLYQRTFGFERSILPSVLKVFIPAQKKVITIDSVTGFAQSGNYIDFGKSMLISQDQEGAAVTELLADKYSKHWGIAAKTILHEYILFNDGTEARFTIAYQFRLSNGDVTSLGKPGFDYCDASGKKIRRQGAIKDNEIGNENAVSVDWTARQSKKGSNGLFISRPSENADYAVVCALFFK